MFKWKDECLNKVQLSIKDINEAIAIAMKSSKKPKYDNKILISNNIDSKIKEITKGLYVLIRAIEIKGTRKIWVCSSIGDEEEGYEEWFIDQNGIIEETNEFDNLLENPNTWEETNWCMYCDFLIKSNLLKMRVRAI